MMGGAGPWPWPEATFADDEKALRAATGAGRAAYATARATGRTTTLARDNMVDES